MKSVLRWQNTLGLTVPYCSRCVRSRFYSSRVPVNPLHAADFPQSKSPKILLRDYQEECIRSVLSYMEKGHKRLGVSLATGSGKTVSPHLFLDTGRC